VLYNNIDQIPYDISSGIVTAKFICQEPLEGKEVGFVIDAGPYETLEAVYNFNVIDIDGLTLMHLAYFNYLNNNRGTLGLDGFESSTSFVLVQVENVKK